MKTFLDFMRTAYQVNNCFDLNSLLSEKSAIDWNSLVKTDLDVINEEITPEESQIKNDEDNDKSIEIENLQIQKQENNSKNCTKNINSPQISKKTSPKYENQVRIKKIIRITL